jgi:hypothetical protein
MLRLETETGYWLITHPDHARLAGAFARHWGNALFAKPEPRKHVLHAIHVHDDGWAVRDAHPTITRQGKPSAFSSELVGKYSAFEEIDLAEYLAVRRRAVDQVSATDPYAALLVSMHTMNLLTERADRATISPGQLPLLDAFLKEQAGVEHMLRNEIEDDIKYAAVDFSNATIQNNFRLLQACDNLSLLSCVAYMQPATLLHPLPTTDGGSTMVAVTASAPRQFHLSPYPFDEVDLSFEVPARHVEGHIFASAGELQQKFTDAGVQGLTITVSP